MPVGGYWSDDKYVYWTRFVYGETIADRENGLKLEQQKIRQEANSWHYKGEGQTLVSMTVERPKNRDYFIIEAKLERTVQKKFKRKKGKK